MWKVISLVQVWTRVAVSISYDDNHYTTGTSKMEMFITLTKYNTPQRHGEGTTASSDYLVNKNTPWQESPAYLWGMGHTHYCSSVEVYNINKASEVIRPMKNPWNTCVECQGNNFVEN